MYYQNALKNFIMEKLCWDNEDKVAEKLLKAFSQYVVSTNKDFLYNKTYFNLFIEEFLSNIVKLKKKYNVMRYHVPKVLKKVGMGKIRCIVIIDDIFIYKDKTISLADEFCASYCNNDKLRIVVKYVDNTEDDERLLIAKEIKIDCNNSRDISQNLQQVFEEAKERYGDCTNEQQ